MNVYSFLLWMDSTCEKYKANSLIMCIDKWFNIYIAHHVKMEIQDCLHSSHEYRCLIYCILIA